MIKSMLKGIIRVRFSMLAILTTAVVNIFRLFYFTAL